MLNKIRKSKDRDYERWNYKLLNWIWKLFDRWILSYHILSYPRELLPHVLWVLLRTFSGLLHHTNLRALNPHRRIVLGVLLAHPGRRTRPGCPRDHYCAHHDDLDQQHERQSAQDLLPQVYWCISRHLLRHGVRIVVRVCRGQLYRKQVHCCSISVLIVSLLWPSDVTWGRRSGSTLAVVIACCLRAPRQYLNQCWLIIRRCNDNQRGQFDKKYPRDHKRGMSLRRSSRGPLSWYHIFNQRHCSSIEACSRVDEIRL